MKTDMNTTGYLCYAEQWANYTDECYSKDSSANWILLNPFDSNYTNEMIKSLSNDTDPIANQVTGLIFDLDERMTADGTYNRPPIISEATTS